MARIYLSPPDVGDRERQLLLDAFDSNWIAPLGPHVDAFERELGGIVGAYALALSSGTAALHLALQVLGVGRGDEVLVSTLTFAATANAITYVGAEPVFIDSDPGTWNMDPVLLREELDACARRGRLPGAVVVVDLYGQSADYDRIRAACDLYGVPIIQDAAEALGATYRGRPAGTQAEVGVYSFNGNKLIKRTVTLSAAEANALYAKAHASRSVIGEIVRILRAEQHVRSRIRQTAEVRVAMNLARWLRPARNTRPSAGDSRVAAPKWPGPPSHDEPPLHLLSPTETQLYARKTRVSIDKAARLLDYRPRFDLDAGMGLTELWARWANLLGDTSRELRPTP